jgi:formyl-CoA transferase
MIMQSTLGETPAPGLHALTAPFGAYKANDGYVAIAVLGEKIWGRFCEAIDRRDLVDDERLQTGIARHAEAKFLTALIEEWLATRGRDDAAEHFRSFGVPAAPIRDVDEIVDDPQVLAREMLLSLEDPEWGSVRVVGQPIKASGALPPRRDPPPRLGQHTVEVLGALAGVDISELESLRADGVV